MSVKSADRHMRPSDAFAWYMERDPLLRSTVVVVGLVDRPPDMQLLRRRVERASRVATAFRDRLVHPPLRLARPRWVQVADLDLDWHVRHVAVPSPAGLDEVLDIARTAASSAFDPARPLWHLTVVDGLADGRAAFVMAFHHALTDGIGGIHLAAELFDLERDPSPRDEGPPVRVEDLEGWRLLRDTVAHDAGSLLGGALRLPATVLRESVHAARHPLDTLRTAASVARTVEPYFTTMSPVMRQRRLERSLHVLEVPLPDLRLAAKAHGGRLNDAFLAAVTGGLRRYHGLHGSQVDHLRVTLPISLRTEADPDGGNRITLMRFKVPAGTEHAGERLWATHHAVERVRGERSLPHTQGIAAMLTLLPPGVVGSMLKHVDFLASDVPGVPVPIYLAGSLVESWYPFGPTIGAALNVTLMSYQDRCCIGVNIDRGAVPDPELLMTCLREGFDEVLALASPVA